MPVTATTPSTTLYETADITNAVRADTGSTRKDNLINYLLDNVLHEFRQLRVWDEHARRAGGMRLGVCYSPSNPTFTPQVFDGQNERVPDGEVSFDFDSSTFTVVTDDGNEDFFVTYEFDLFPPKEIEAFIDWTLQEINATAEQGTHVTTYSTLDQAPAFWDGIIVSGVAAKAFRRIATDNMMWKNWLIWVDGNNGQQIAADSSAYFTTTYDELRRGAKRQNFLAKPTGVYDLFRNTGFGFIQAQSGKFRELRVNRLASI